MKTIIDLIMLCMKRKQWMKIIDSITEELTWALIANQFKIDIIEYINIKVFSQHD